MGGLLCIHRDGAPNLKDLRLRQRRQLILTHPRGNRRLFQASFIA